MPPALRAGFRGWIGYFNELVVDHIRHHDLEIGALVDLLIAALVATVQAALAAAPELELNPEMVAVLGSGASPTAPRDPLGGAGRIQTSAVGSQTFAP